MIDPGDLENMTPDELRRVVEQFAVAVSGRDAIGMAKGILMATGNLTEEKAFGVLRHASQRENRKIRVIAQEIVDRHNARVRVSDLDAPAAD